MKNIRLIRRAFRVDQHLVLRTPQVETAIQQMISVLQSEADSVVYLSGLSGSGVSFALNETTRRFDHANGVRCFMLARPEVDDDYLPSEYLLHRFGFRFGARTRPSHYHKTLPREIIELGSMLPHSIMLVDDYLAGVGNLAQKRTHMYQWNELAAPPISLRFVLAGPSNHIKGSCASHELNGRTICIEEWRFNELLQQYLSDFSLLIYQMYEIDMDLPRYAKPLFKHSQGNTALLLDYIRECVRRTILSAEKGVSAKLFKLSFREMVHSNAKLFRYLTGT